MNPLLQHPRWRPDDLGLPIPESPYAVSVALPTWQDNVGYEEGDPLVVNRLQAGYPRFVFHPLCRQLFALCQQRWGGPGETCLVFPTPGSGQRFVEWMQRRAGIIPRRIPLAPTAAQAAFFPQSAAAEGKAFWQHTGEGISPRHAESVGKQLRGELIAPTLTGDSKKLLKERLAQTLGVPPENVWLFPCGMNAAFQIHGALGVRFGNRPSVQFGFPYVDTLKIQEKIGPGARFFPKGDASDLAKLVDLAAAESIGPIYTEFPSNPLLNSPDLDALAALAKRHNVPLIVDDTVASSHNVDLAGVADIVWMSLTKYFSGVGDVTGGAAVVNPRGRMAGELSSALSAHYEDLIFEADAEALERNSRDAEERIRTINRNAEQLADWLGRHPLVETVYFPKFRTPELYRKFLRPGGGYGGLLSLDLKEPAMRAPRMFDALRVCKGPNLGMSYTLACPYTVLAHYQEFDFAEACGVSRWLVRVSVGCEPIEELIQRFDSALRATEPSPG